ncbi:PEPxxWA-CTERM sorting domain-containing protein [Sphingomonas qilianensis]|uniref:PEPxxWA-CTERM sorting domain-containing protein n=1 Tax=Sphingomonas qilianensis TaxID=1736690 RepID=A0ABU9XSA8_9SPHN
MIIFSIAARGASAVALLAAAPSFAATFGTGTVALGATTYTQDFDTLARTGTTGTALPTGWRVSETGANSNSSYGVGTGSNNAGDVLSYGAAGSSDRALGTLRSGNLIPTIGAVFTNATGTTITDLLVGFTGEQWRNGSASIDSLGFQYSLTSTNIGDAIGSSAWTSVLGLTFSAPNNAAVSGLDGNLNSTSLSSTLSGLSIGSGASFAFRWIDADPSGADDGLAIDNFSVGSVVTAVPEPSTWAMMLVGFGAVGGAMRRRRSGATRVAFAG